jgi:hypothetical protein
MGPLTMASLDQYLRLEPGANPMPPKEGSVEDKLEDLHQCASVSEPNFNSMPLPKCQPQPFGTIFS